MSSQSPPSSTRRAVLGLCAASVAGLAGCGAAGRNCPSPSRAGASEDWSSPYHDPGNSNAAPSGPTSLSERWTFRTESSLLRPVVVDGTVFTLAVSRDRPFDTRVVALDADTGEREWEYPVENAYRGRIAAALDGRVFAVGEPLDDDDPQRLFVVDEGGSLAWTFEADVISSVAVAGPVVLVSVLHESVVALEAATGRPCARFHPANWPVGRWLSNVTPVGRPAVLDETVFSPFARYDVDREDDYFDDRVVAFDADGEIRWESPVVDALVVEEIAAVGDTVYVPATHRSERRADRGTATLHALDASTGTGRWSQPLQSEFPSPVAVREGVVVVTGDGLQAFDAASGDPRWQSGALFGPPVIAGGRVYGRRTVGDFVDTVVAADLATGDPIASHTFDYQVNRAPVFADGRAFVRTLAYEDEDDGPEHVADRIHALW